MPDELEEAKRVAESWHLGQTSATYESGTAGPGAISTGKGDHGGVSYGAYQFSSAEGTLQEYLNQSDYGAKFSGLTPVTPAFDTTWRELARDDAGFGRDQHDFVGKSHYAAQAARLADKGIDLSDRGMAVQDALWSTSVQCRGLTPGIFTKGLTEKFGEHYELAKLSDKDIVDAVQDYKTSHVATLFSRSPTLHESLKDRFADEKVALDRLADSDATLRANGIVVQHSDRPAPSVGWLQESQHGSHAPHSHALRLNDRSAEVGKLQAQLTAAGYTGPGDQPLHNDNHFGPATKAAVEAFQRSHHLSPDGIAGAHTLRALQNAQPVSAALLDNPAHGGHTMYGQALGLVHVLDAQQGRTPDQFSANFAGAVASQSRAEGMTQINHLVLSDDASRAYAVQGDLNSPFKQYTSVDVAQAVAQPLEQSSQAWSHANQQQVASSVVEEQHQAPSVTSMSR